MKKFFVISLFCLLAASVILTSCGGGGGGGNGLGDIDGDDNGATTYTVSFDVQGYGIAPAQLNVESGSKITAPTMPTAPTVDKYLFKGWYKEASYTDKWDFSNDKVTGNITLYAKWLEGVLPGQFSVSSNKKVYFSQGNLRANIDASGIPTEWKFAVNQNDILGSSGANQTIGSVAGDVDYFGWSTSATNYGINNSNDNSVYAGEFVDWGTAMSDDGLWRTLTGGSSGEWKYLLSTRSASTVSGVSNARYLKCKVDGINGMVIFPDSLTWPAGLTEPDSGKINKADEKYTTSYSASDFEKLETAGCVFIPISWYRSGSTVRVDYMEPSGYWASTTSSATGAQNLFAHDNAVNAEASDGRSIGYFVRLVTEVD